MLMRRRPPVTAMAPTTATGTAATAVMTRMKLRGRWRFRLIVLAVASVLAGYVGVPHALHGSNEIESFLEPSFEACLGAVADRRGRR